MAELETGGKSRFWWLYRGVGVATILSALLHTAVSYRLTGASDILFVIGLLVNSLLLVYVVRKARRILVDQYSLYTEEEIFPVNWMIPLGFAWGTVFGLTPYWVPVPFLPNDPLLKGTAALFLFSHNTLTGFCICPLVRFYILVIRYKRTIDPELWDRSDPSYKGHLLIFELLIVFISLICAIAVAAAFASCFELGLFLPAFALFCSGFVLSAYLVPRYPLIVQLRRKKDARLEEIDAMIEQEYSAQIDAAKSGQVANVEKLEKLKELRTIVAETGGDSFPVERRVRRIFGSIFMPLVPAIIKFFTAQIPQSLWKVFSTAFSAAFR